MFQQIFITYMISAALLLAAAFVIFRIFVRRDYLRRGRLTLMSTMLETVIWGIYLSFPYIYNPSSWAAFWLPDQEVHPLLRYVGMVSIVAGFTLGLMAMTSLGFRRSFGQEVNVLKQTGLYGLSRNPQIVLFFPLIVGVASRWPSWYAVGWVVLFVAMIHIMVLTEEEHLRKVFGEEYVRYCARVPRYLGFPRGVAS
jgi:protein-S-isoprenylcysteine O-methyltransferase Ste14